MRSLTSPPLVQYHPFSKTTISLEQNHTPNTTTTTLKWKFPHNSKTSLVLPITSKHHHHSCIVSCMVDNSLELSLSSDSVPACAATDKKNKVICFFETHGFSKQQVSDVIRKLPQVLTSNPDKTLLSKFEFFYAKGFSKDQLASVIARSPFLLRRSLENHIVPTYEYLESFIGCNVKTNAAIRRGPYLLYKYKGMVSIIRMMQECGMSESNISVLLVYSPIVFRTDPDMIRRHVERVKRLGFDPKDKKFAIAVKAMRGMNESSWERKVNAYKRWGWSEEDVLDAFGRCPWCMVISEDKIKAVMEFFTEQLDYKPSGIFSNPSLLLLSLDKRVKPRVAVIRVLLSKGLIKRKHSWGALFKYSEKIFLENFVECYEEEAPQLLKLYKEASITSSLK